MPRNAVRSPSRNRHGQRHFPSAGIMPGFEKNILTLSPKAPKTMMMMITSRPAPKKTALHRVNPKHERIIVMNQSSDASV